MKKMYLRIFFLVFLQFFCLADQLDIFIIIILLLDIILFYVLLTRRPRSLI